MEPRSEVLVAHQPAYLPWQGYFARLLDVDRLVLLDHVQFAERGRQHRNHIRGPRGDRLRLTVPVRRRFGQPINQVLIADGDWARRHWRAIEQTYRRAPYWHVYAPALAGLYRREWILLVDLNLVITRFFLDALGIRVALVRSSDLEPAGHRTGMLVDLCRKTDTCLLRVGTGGSQHYLNPTVLAEAGIGVEIADYTDPPYPQGPGPFTPALSILDLLMHTGPDAVRVLATGLHILPWRPGAGQ